MPFMGRDWRSPGEAWVKTETLGWQRMKIIESQLYLSACHQNHPACSWPPKSQFGQHMAKNCSRQSESICDQVDSETKDRRSFSCATSNGYCESTENLCGTIGCSSRGSDGSSSSGNSSSHSSTSTSPTSSPEKNNVAHHIHPIKISSPYGRYSTSCCAHHFHPISDPVLPVDNSLQHCLTATCNINHHDGDLHGIKTGSIMMANDVVKNQSRAMVNLTQASTKGSSILRPNKSVSDFRCNAGTTCQELFDQKENFHSGVAVGDSGGHVMIEEGFCSRASNRPILMRNGVQMDEKEMVGGGSDCFEHAGGVDLPSRSPMTEVNQHEYLSGSRSAPIMIASANQQRVVTSQPSSSYPSSCGCCCGSNYAHNHLIKELQQPKTAPHCRISVRTREVAMHNTISEAFYRLDFYNAIHDIRRFNYICKLLHLLITQNLTSLSGCATRVLFIMLEQVAREVSSNKRNIHIIKNLLNELKQIIQKNYCWGRPIGSSLLWQQHFETIERISQIVDEIELAPPKNDSYKMNFNKLPVEMIREILLRLNDYRDLVSSAQASPVMRTMIDSQYIWRKMCSYHFTEQQLKLAFDSNKFNFVKRHTLRGVKYARTTSADGKSSYRSLTTGELQSSPASGGLASATAVGLRQSEEPTNALHHTSDKRRPSSSEATTSSSHVTNAVRIFDKQSLPSAASSSTSTSIAKNDNRMQRSCREAGERTCQSSSAISNANDDHRSTPEIDWERVFHQLRKRFDLKEEYADCLLLCRHCRCLFWKSFGHPCIKGNEVQHQQPHHNADCRLANSNLALRDNSNYKCGTCNLPDREVVMRDGESPILGRISVASLSRNFDRQAQAPQGSSNNENIVPANSVQLGPVANANSNLGTNNNEQRARDSRRRRPLDNLGVQLRELNHDRQQRQAARRQPLLADNPQLLRAQDNAQSSVNERKELVPKHVTISPQAFLKFFSL